MAGEVLKKRREDLGLGLKEISELLKIRQDYLSSIEEDRFEKLPVAVYTLGYIRCYASYLKIDAEPIIASYTGNLSIPQSATIIPVASSKKGLPLYGYVIMALAAVAVSVTLFLIFHRPSAIGRPVNFTAERPGTPEATKPASQPESVIVPQAGSPDRSSKETLPSTQPVRSDEHRITVFADEMTWMKIETSARSEEALLRPGTSRTWDFRTKAVLKIGNAGGIRLNFDGRDIGSPGTSGQVITLVFPEGTEDRSPR